MNNPEYILADEIETVVAAVKAQLGIPVLNYQYGEIEELVQTLEQLENSRTNYDAKFPLFYLAEPFEVTRGEEGIYGEADVSFFIINTTQKQWKARERMTNNFKPIIYPIYREFLNQLVLSSRFSHLNVETLRHKYINRYWWGEDKKSVINDVVDCMKISGLKVRISDNQNCSTFSNF